MHNKIENILVSKNTHPTSMRILVYDYLATQDIALSLSEIETHFHKVDRVTLYRTLKTFEQKGIIHGIHENNITKYKLCSDECNEKTHKDRHLHFYCKICKETTCKENFNLPEIANTNYRIDEVSLPQLNFAIVLHLKNYKLCSSNCIFISNEK